MKERIHSHPKLEEKLGLDDNHRIIDTELYHELLQLNLALAVICASHFSKKESK